MKRITEEKVSAINAEIKRITENDGLIISENSVRKIQDLWFSNGCPENDSEDNPFFQAVAMRLLYLRLKGQQTGMVRLDSDNTITVVI